MKRLIGLTSAALIFGALIGPSAAMSAGNGAVATPFTASYQSTFKGIITSNVCSGSHIAQTKTNNSFYKDSETCLTTGETSGFVAGTYSSFPGSPNGIIPPYGPSSFRSDSSVEPGALAISWTMTISLNTDGSVTENIVAYYAS